MPATGGTRAISTPCSGVLAGPPSPLQFNAEKSQAYAPFSIDADALPENPGGWPKGGTTEINLPNSICSTS